MRFLPGHIFPAAALLLACSLLSFRSAAQANLVPNGGFEDYLLLPTEIGQFRRAFPWATFAPGNQPADYFHRQAKPRTGAPDNFIGRQEPRGGDGYGGFLLYLNSKDEYTEFIQVPLMGTLQAGEAYQVEMYVSLAEDSEYAVDGLGLYFSAQPPLLAQGHYARLQPQISNASKNILADKQQWMRVAGTFTAQGDERFLTIGNFKPRQQNTVRKVKTERREKEPYKYAYYFFDDIRVSPVKPAAAIPAEYFGPLAPNQAVALKNIHFALDEATLLPASLPELNRLYELLAQSPQLRIWLEGHTDNTHTAAYNQKLSEDRARAVQDYLVAKGIAASRLQTRGHGSSQPVAANNTEAGRQQNRRVEFRIIGE
jgi:outer membrane protein OmpA-like peptidoglycan-associated protein